MPRRSILTATERQSLLGWPEAKAELIRHYTLSATDLAMIRQHRGAANRLGYAVQLCSMRFPGVALGAREQPFIPLLETVAAQLKVPVESWSEYGHRAETRREHALELQAIFGFKPFTMRHYRTGSGASRRSRRRLTKESCWPPRWSKSTAGSRCCFRRSTI